MLGWSYGCIHGVCGPSPRVFQAIGDGNLGRRTVVDPCVSVLVVFRCVDSTLAFTESVLLNDSKVDFAQVGAIEAIFKCYRYKESSGFIFSRPLQIPALSLFWNTLILPRMHRSTTSELSSEPIIPPSAVSPATPAGARPQPDHPRPSQTPSRRGSSVRI